MWKAIIGIGLGLILTSAAWASTTATATISSVPNGPNFDYSLSLTNTGQTPISTFWFGWIPNYNLLLNQPTPTSPSGWSATTPPEDFYTPGFYSIEWQATTDGGGTTHPLAPGQTLTGFNFNSPDDPGSVNGPSYYFGSFYPSSTSYVYTGLGQVGTACILKPTVVPSPAPV